MVMEETDDEQAPPDATVQVNTEQYVVALIFDQPSNIQQVYCARQEYVAPAGEII